MNDSKNILILADENGKEKEFYSLFTVECENGKNFIAYTDKKEDKNGNFKVYAAKFDPSGKNKYFTPIEDADELTLINNILSSIKKKIESENK